jgi:hypothetical protein
MKFVIYIFLPWWSVQGFIASVDDTLELRARSGCGGLDRLAISLDIWNVAASGNEGLALVQPSIAAAERWIRCAVRHGVKLQVYKRPMGRRHGPRHDLLEWPMGGTARHVGHL